MPPLKIMEVPCKSWIWKSRLHFPLNSPSPTDNKLTRAVTTQATVATPGAPASSFPRHPASSTSLTLREGRPHRAVPPLAGGRTSGWCQAHLQISLRRPPTSRTAAALRRPSPVGTRGAGSVTPARLREGETPLEEAPRRKAHDW